MLDATAVLAILQATDDRSSSNPREFTITSFFCADIFFSSNTDFLKLRFVLLNDVDGVQRGNQSVSSYAAPGWKIGRRSRITCDDFEQSATAQRLKLASKSNDELSASVFTGIPLIFH
jgi:hypothetical protein